MPIDNVNIESQAPLTPPRDVREEIPAGKDAVDTVGRARRAVQEILDGRDDRIFMVVGPCSIHSAEGAREYASRLRALAPAVEDRILLLMRVYFEKPRTTLGWKGLIYDPDLDGSYNIEKGLRLARTILRDINAMGIPAGSEMLDPITPQYVADLISWAAIGARTSESQTHRQLASGLSMPVGFKNNTDGSIKAAVDAVKAASAKHSFIGVTGDGRCGVFATTGNPYCHIILRGGGPDRTNYASEYIAFARELMRKSGLPPRIMVDCSHANSGKDPLRQVDVMREVIPLAARAEEGIVGLMVESNLKTGRQEISASPDPGLSVTDPCLGWEETEALIREAYALLENPPGT